MNIPFEAKYINIEWEDSSKKIALNVFEARDTIEIESSYGRVFQLEAVTYPKIEDKTGQLAFHIIDKRFKRKPYFINAKNQKVELVPIKDKDSEKTWWIENRKGVSSSLYRTVGETKLVIGDYTCLIHMGSLSFTYDELELYLKDFRSDLWGLIQKNDSYVLGEAKNKETKIAKVELIKKIQSFISFTEKILKNPKKELVREYTLQKASQVRPIPKTFMELATKGASAKYLTGQGYRDSFDVAENRYIFALVQKLINLVGHELEVIKKRLQELERELSDITEQIKKLSNTLQSNELIVDKKEINNSIKHILNSQQKKLTEYEIIFLKFEKKIRDNLFEGKGKRNRDDEWFTKKGIIFRFEFKGNSINKFLKEGCEYKITAHYQKFPRDKNTYRYFFQDISDVELLTDYTRPLNKNENEKKEFQYELKALKKKENSLSEQLNSTKEVYNLILPQLAKLKKIKLFFVKYKIKSRYHFTGSMTFIQNPNYQGSHKLYKQIIDKSGMNDDLFDSLEEIDKIGILDIPTLYERWCLLQIIKVLMNKFHFIPTDKNWKKILTEQVSINNSKNITLNFKNTNIDREVRLTYEMVLESGRTPDFVLDIKGRENKYHRFVMDAKFYENLDISIVVDELYNKKDYAENGNNSVFILHPSKNQKSYYGEKEKFEWDNAFPNHRYGAVSLSPIQKTGSYLHELQKLIGMFLQYGMEDNQNIRVNNKLDPIPKEKLFCMICGGSHQQIEQTRTRGGNYKYWVTCNDCSHMTIYNYCGKCKNRLIKNGSYWTYHSMDILEPINIQCPCCGDMF